MVSFAAGDVEITDDNYYDISVYRSGANYTYPEKEGYVFAGWYTDKNLKTSLGGDVTTGNAYAKFVDENVLSVKCQLTAGTTEKSETTNLRMVTTVDNLRYQSAGFQITVGKITQITTSKTVYTQITGYIEKDGATYYKPTVFSDESAYFMAYNLNDIPHAAFAKGIKITPQWTTLDGTSVKGMAKTLAIYSEVGENLETTISAGEVWSAPSTVKIQQNETNFVNKGEASLSYQAVRNEYENCQLFITPTEEIMSYELTAVDLKNGNEILSAENVEVYVQKYIPYNDFNGKGVMPDALIPVLAADEYGENASAAGKNAGLWISIYIPKDALAGTYTGNFFLTVNNEVMKVPVSVEVLDYTLTDELTAETVFSWRYARVAAGELDGSNAMMQYYYEYFQKYRISLQTLPLETLSGEEFVENVVKYYDKLSSFAILRTLGDISTDLESYPKIVQEEILALAAASNADRNLFDKAVIYSIDEPDVTSKSVRMSLVSKITAISSNLQNCVDIIEADKSGIYDEFKKIDGWKASIMSIPNIIPLTECHAKWLITNQEMEDVQALLDVCNCICPLFTTYNEDSYADLRKMADTYGLELWWYGAGTNTGDGPTYNIGNLNLLSSRTVSWLQNKYDVAGNLYWDAAAYTNESGDFYNEYVNVYEWPYRFSHGYASAGDGFLTYPGEAYGVYGPLPSLRLMSIRDGMEEYEILKDVERKLTEQSADVDTIMNKFYNAVSSGGVNLYSDRSAIQQFADIRSKLLQLAVNPNSSTTEILTMTTLADSENTQTSVQSDVSEDAKETAALGMTSVSSLASTTDSVTLTNAEGKNYVSQKYYKRAKKGQYISFDISVSPNQPFIINILDDGSKVIYEKWYAAGTTGVVMPTALIETTNYFTIQVIYDSSMQSIWKENVTTLSDIKILGAGDTVTLHSFESYADITGTAIRVSSSLGETNVNKDSQFIRDGKGSWQIMPQGDYGAEDGYSWFRMRCMTLSSNGTAFGTTFKDSNFLKYNRVLLDVYNASDEAASVKWNFTTRNVRGEYSDTPVKTYVLQPKQWTTIEFELSGNEYECFYDLTTVKYMTITFLDKKASKDDIVPTLYLDYLRGEIAETTHTAPTLTYNISQGKSITFEDVDDYYELSSYTNWQWNMQTERAAYADTTLADLDESLGAYCYKGTVGASALWPAWTTHFGKEYGTDHKMTFMLYVEADKNLTADKLYSVQACKVLGDETDAFVRNGQNLPFNQWVQVEVYLPAANDSVCTFINLNDGTGKPLLGDAQVNIYLDNIEIIEITEETSATITNIAGAGKVGYRFYTTAKAGQYIGFDIEITPTQPFIINIISDTGKVVYEKWYKAGTTSVIMPTALTEDMKYFEIRIFYDVSTKDKWKECVTKLSNVEVSGNRLEFTEKDTGDTGTWDNFQ